MLRLYNDDNSDAYILDNISNFHIKRISGGEDELYFDISTNDPLFPYLKEEIYMEYDNRYIIKNINRRSLVTTVQCELDFDAFKERFYKDYLKTTDNVANHVSAILPTGWSVINESLITSQKTLELEGVNDFDILFEIQDLFSVVYKIDNINKIVKIVNTELSVNRGTYFTDGLNLEKIEYKGDSSGYVTRLYPYGADDLSIASVNSGNAYIDDFSYSNKIISAIWKDDRYTNAQALKEDAIEVLKQNAVPEQSYVCSVIDLAKIDTKYSFLDVKLYDKVTLLDSKTDTRAEHLVVEYNEYPQEPERNIITLSSVPSTISNSVKAISATLDKSNLTGGLIEQAVLNATNLITGQVGGYVVLDPPEKPSRILIMDTDDKSTAQNVWQWNLNGLGYSTTGINGTYGLAMTMDGAIVADFITTGILSSILIQSDNYIENTSGTLIDLNDGSIDMPNFKVDSSGNLSALNADIIGTINATTMKIKDILKMYITGQESTFYDFIYAYNFATDHDIIQVGVSTNPKILFDLYLQSLELIAPGGTYFSSKIVSNAGAHIGISGLYGLNSDAVIVDPQADNDLFFGTSSASSGVTTQLRGNNVRIYAHSGGAVYLGATGSVLVTSDENLKDMIDFDERYEVFFDNIAPRLYTYKKNGHRVHAGFGARQIENSLVQAGLGNEDFAGLCKDENITISADENGTDEDVFYSELYSLRYEEFISINTYMIKKQMARIDELEEKTYNLECELKEIKDLLTRNNIS